MGILGSLLSGMTKMMAEELWPRYEDAKMRKNVDSLEKIIENETNNTRKAVYLLALGAKDTFRARQFYINSRASYNTAFNNLRSYQKFSPVIDRFMRECT